jgi:hypothetical protein
METEIVASAPPAARRFMEITMHIAAARGWRFAWDEAEWHSFCSNPADDSNGVRLFGFFRNDEEQPIGVLLVPYDQSEPMTLLAGDSKTKIAQFSQQLPE